MYLSFLKTVYSQCSTGFRKRRRGMTSVRAPARVRRGRGCAHGFLVDVRARTVHQRRPCAHRAPTMSVRAPYPRRAAALRTSRSAARAPNMTQAVDIICIYMLHMLHTILIRMLCIILIYHSCTHVVYHSQGCATRVAHEPVDGVGPELDPGRQVRPVEVLDGHPRQLDARLAP
jgi:hypothetical protein